MGVNHFGLKGSPNIGTTYPGETNDMRRSIWKKSSIQGIHYLSHDSNSSASSGTAALPPGTGGIVYSA
jgi:hypothetical protein